MTSPLCLWVDHGIFTFNVLSPHHCTTHAFIRQDLQPREGGRDKKNKVSSPNDKDVVFGATGAISSGLGGFSIPPCVRPQVVEAGSHYLRSQS